MSLLEEFRDAWPDDTPIDEPQLTKLLAAFTPDVVRQVIADRLEADLPRPGLAELSRVLRVYQGVPSKDPQPEPSKVAPRRPWVSELDDAPEMDPNWRERLAEIRKILEPSAPQGERP